MTDPTPADVDTLWINANLATMASSGFPYGAVEDGAIAVAGGKIAWVGAAKDLPGGIERRAGQVHDAGGRWITPGLIDCHTHLVYAGSRAREFELRLLGASYEDIARQGGGIRSTVAATRAAPEDELFRMSARRLSSFLREGVTTMEIKSGYGLDLESELKILRVIRRLGREFPVTVYPTFLGAHALPPEYEERGDDYIDFLCREVLPAAVEQGLVRAVDAFCETIGFSYAQTERMFEAAKRWSLPVKLHAEQLSDQDGASLAARFQALSADHLEHLSERGVRAMAESGTVAVLLPGAYYFLRDTQAPPVQLLRGHGVPLAVASDTNPGTCPAGSLLLMLNMACTLFRLTPEEALAGVTRNAARALGMQDRVGTLEAGKDADFVIWDISEPAELGYRFGFNPAVTVVKAGMSVD
jgi:imidazolonepropionase